MKFTAMEKLKHLEIFMHFVCMNGNIFFTLVGGDRKHRYGVSRGKMPLSLTLPITFISIIVLVGLASTILYMYVQRRRRNAEGQGNY